MDSIIDLPKSTQEIFIRLIINIVVLFILLKYIYFPYNGKRRMYFTYYLIGIMIFIISSFLGMVDIQMGFALGLFAIFSIIRYRTPPIEIKDMTYLFLVIGIAVVNALVHFAEFWRGIIISNIVILLSTYFLEKHKPRKTVLRKQLVYSPLDFSIINNVGMLKEELESLLNMSLIKVTVEKVNIAKNELTVTIYYKVEFDKNDINNENSKIIYNK